MDPKQRHAQVKRVFREALRWAPAERAEVVAALAEDGAVRDEVLSLLAHHREEEAEAEAAAAPGGGAVDGGRTLAELLRGECGERGGRGGGGGGGSAAGWGLDRVVRTLAPIAEALASLADRGVVHGAVRADRIVLDGGGDAGEGVARLAGGSGGSMTGGGEPAAPMLDAAAAAAAAPEQLSPALGPPGPWTDVYALALLCVELMLGRPAGGATITAALARARDEAAQPTPRAVGLAVPDAVDAVLARALAMRPMDRYQDVRRFWTALREGLAASAPARPASHASPASRPSPSPGPPAAASNAGAPARRPWRPWSALAAAARALAGAVVLAVAAVAAVAVALQRCT